MQCLSRMVQTEMLLVWRVHYKHCCSSCGGDAPHDRAKVRPPDDLGLSLIALLQNEVVRRSLLKSDGEVTNYVRKTSDKVTKS